jgi:hypothetical protein
VAMLATERGETKALVDKKLDDINIDIDMFGASSLNILHVELRKNAVVFTCFYRLT